MRIQIRLAISFIAAGLLLACFAQNGLKFGDLKVGAPKDETLKRLRALYKVQQQESLLDVWTVWSEAEYLGEVVFRDNILQIIRTSVSSIDGKADWEFGRQLYQQLWFRTLPVSDHFGEAVREGIAKIRLDSTGGIGDLLDIWIAFPNRPKESVHLRIVKTPVSQGVSLYTVQKF